MLFILVTLVLLTLVSWPWSVNRQQKDLLLGAQVSWYLWFSRTWDLHRVAALAVNHAEAFERLTPETSLSWQQLQRDHEEHKAICNTGALEVFEHMSANLEVPLQDQLCDFTQGVLLANRDVPEFAPLQADLDRCCAELSESRRKMQAAIVRYNQSCQGVVSALVARRMGRQLLPVPAAG